MPDTRQLPPLLRLVDDESPTVRTAVLRELAAYGDELEAALRALPAPPDEQTLAEVLATVGRFQQAESEGARERVVRELSAREEGARETREGGPREGGARGGEAARFTEGQLVRHKRYGYRGVVVARDTSCRAPDDWYLNNRTQPDRDQPWYHVLVHEAGHVTYAAQTSLLPDESTQAVRHPYLEQFFDGFVDGRYVRNDRPWPDVDG